jgi:hypothetical protein
MMEKKGRFKPFLWGALIAAVVLPLVPLFDHLGKPEFERAVPLALIVVLTVLKVCWDLRNRPWFWATVIGIAALHVPLVMRTAQWLNRIPFRATLFLVIADVLVILAVISLIERLTGSKDASVSAASGNPKSHF